MSKNSLSFRSGARIHAVRSIHNKLLQEVFELLEVSTLKINVFSWNTTLRQSGITGRSLYSQTFDSLRHLRKV